MFNLFVNVAIANRYYALVNPDFADLVEDLVGDTAAVGALFSRDLAACLRVAACFSVRLLLCCNDGTA